MIPHSSEKRSCRRVLCSPWKLPKNCSRASRWLSVRKSRLSMSPSSFALRKRASAFTRCLSMSSKSEIIISPQPQNMSSVSDLSPISTLYILYRVHTAGMGSITLSPVMRPKSSAMVAYSGAHMGVSVRARNSSFMNRRARLLGYTTVTLVMSLPKRTIRSLATLARNVVSLQLSLLFVSIVCSYTSSVLQFFTYHRYPTTLCPG